jgi:hypothetical protein
MRILAAGLLSIAILGAAITPGWCHQPPKKLGADATATPPCGTQQCKLMESGRQSARPNAMDRLGGGSANPVRTGKAALGGTNARAPVTAAATVKPAVGSVVVQPPPKTPDTNFSYGAGSGGSKKDVFKQPR